MDVHITFVINIFIDSWKVHNNHAPPFTPWLFPSLKIEPGVHCLPLSLLTSVHFLFKAISPDCWQEGLAQNDQVAFSTPNPGRLYKYAISSLTPAFFFLLTEHTCFLYPKCLLYNVHICTSRHGNLQSSPYRNKYPLNGGLCLYKRFDTITRTGKIKEGWLLGPVFV